MAAGRKSGVQTGRSALAYALLGELDDLLLERCFGLLLERHEVLRTTFGVSSGEGYQRISTGGVFSLERLDLRGIPEGEREGQLEQVLNAAAREPLDLKQGPLLRALLVEVGPQVHALLVVVHHLVFDGWSERVLFQELKQLYEAAGQGQTLAALPLQYADFAAWQQRDLKTSRLDAAREYWKTQLRDAPGCLDLPTDHPRPSEPTSAGRTLFRNLPEPLREALKQFSRQQQTTLFVTLLAAFKVLLYRYTGQEDLVVGTAVAQRERTELESLIGFFANTVALRTRLSGNLTFRELLQRVQQVTGEAIAHQELPFEQVVQLLSIPRQPSQPSWLQVMFVLHNACEDGLQLPGLQISRLPVDPGTAKFDLTLIAVDQPQGLDFWIEYRTDLFQQETIERLYQHLLVILQEVLKNPLHEIQRLTILTESERRQLLVDWTATATDYPRDKCIHELFEEHAKSAPDRVAIWCGDRSFTYRHANQRANQLARFLMGFGVTQGTVVAICVDRSCEMVIGLLAILKAGGAYLPLSPEDPVQRLKSILDDANATVLVTSQNYHHIFSELRLQFVLVDSIEKEIDGLEADDLPCETVATDLAYVMHTSGSTGKPKGTSIAHRGVVRLVRNTNYVHIATADKFLQLAPLAFDASTFEIWGALLNGATLAIAPPGALSLAEISDCIQGFGITILWLTAGLFQQMVDYQLEGFRGVQQLLAGGDVLSAEHVKRVLGKLPGCRVINGYGPTENTTFTSCCPMVRPEEVTANVSLGRPIANTRVYILNEALELQPIGIPGELFAGGDGLAIGYWRQPLLTQTRFVPHPYSEEPGDRLYRTGDRVRWRPDGTVEFLGRLDQQVKIRGYRVEPGEVQEALKSHPGVLQVVVNTEESATGEKRLVAYVVPVEAGNLTISELHEFLATKIPRYMLPASYVLIEALPLTQNGKIDRRALCCLQTVAKTAVLGGPRSDLEAQLCGLWKELLRVDQVGIHDSFFALGGNSLTAIQFVARAKNLFHVDFPVADIYKLGDISGIGRYIQSELDAQQPLAAVPLVAVPREQRMPLSACQQRLWFLHQLNPGSQAYTLAFGYALLGELDDLLLERCFGLLLERHEVLRTTFGVSSGEGYQRISTGGVFSLERLDLRGIPEGEREGQLEQVLNAAAREPLDLKQGPLLRALLVEVGPQVHALLVVVHHLVFDGWSERVLFQELKQLYEAAGQGQTLAALPLQYADFAAWQQRDLKTSRLDAAREYWKTQLRDAPGCLDLPTDHPRPSEPTSAGRTLFRNLPEPLREALKQFSRQQQTTLFVTLLAAFKVLLYRYTGQEDLVVGTAVAQRERTELESLIGFFANTVALRTRLSGNLTFRELLQRVQQVTGEAIAHQELPFEQVVQLLSIPRQPSQPSWLQVMFVLHNACEDGLQLPGLQISRLPVDPGTAKFDLTLIAVDQPQGLDFWIEYRTDLFQQETIERLYQHLLVILQEVLKNPLHEIQRLKLSQKEERNQTHSNLTDRPGFQQWPRNSAPNTSPSSNAPQTEIEERVAAVWRQLLGVSSICVCDDFFQIGGHSLLAVKLAAELERSLGVRLTVNELLLFSTIREQANLIQSLSTVGTTSSLITLRESTGPTLIMLPGIEGVGQLARAVIRHLPSELRIVGVDLKYPRVELVPASIQDFAKDCVELILSANLAGPYQLVGYSFGGMLAYEVACQLRVKGLPIGLVGIIDTGPIYTAEMSFIERTAYMRHAIANSPTRIASFIRMKNRTEQIQRFLAFLRKVTRRIKRKLHAKQFTSAVAELLEQEDAAETTTPERAATLAYLKAFCGYTPTAYPGPITLFRAQERPVFRGATPDLGWRHFQIGRIEICHVPGDHKSMLDEPYRQVLGLQIGGALAKSIAAN
ncbi:MAG: amino acid adenylation domain-containing protein [Pirellulales bacterium]